VRHLTSTQLDKKIKSFITKKTLEHPDLQTPDGTKAGNMWHADKNLKKFWGEMDTQFYKI
jgi:hypothetical protein